LLVYEDATLEVEEDAMNTNSVLGEEHDREDFESVTEEEIICGVQSRDVAFPRTKHGPRSSPDLLSTWHSPSANRLCRSNIRQ
jgi:hypothetical protein